MNVVLDLDDTLADLRTPMAEVCKMATGVNYGWEFWADSTAHDLHNYGPMDLINSFIEHDTISNLVPHVDAKETVAEIRAMGYKVHILTARGWHPKAREVTAEWFKKNDIEYDELHIVGLHESKLAYIRNHIGEVIAIVDDNVSHTEDFYAACEEGDDIVAHFVYDQPWNQNAPGPRIKSLKLLIPFLSYIKECINEAHQQESYGGTD